MEISNEGRYGHQVPWQRLLSHDFFGCPNFKLRAHHLNMFETFGDIKSVLVAEFVTFVSVNLITENGRACKKM
jgi:hypothetical protein